MDKEIASFSANHSAVFRTTLLDSKAFKRAETPKDSLISQIVLGRFGREVSVQNVGMASLRMGRRSFALAINQACNLVGDAEPMAILRRLAVDHPQDAQAIYPACGLENLLPAKQIAFPPGIYSIANKARCSVLPDNRIVVFNEAGRNLTAYRNFRDLKSVLLAYGVPETSIQRIE